MKIFIALESATVTRCLEKALTVLTSARPTSSFDEADVVVVDNYSDLTRLHDPRKQFICLYASKDWTSGLPGNATAMWVNDLMAELVKLEGKIARRPAVAKTASHE